MAEQKQPLDAADQSVRLGSGSKPVIANESVLAQMEELYRQKLARNQSFLQDLADASAWWSGGVEGPTRGLALRAQTRAAQEKELEDLARNIATTKVGLGQLQEVGRSLQRGDISAPVMGGAPSGGTRLPLGWGTYRGVPVPPEVYETIEAYRIAGDVGKANAAFAEYAKTRGQFLNQPGTFKQEDYWDENLGRTVPRNAYQIQQQELFGPRPTAPAPTMAPRAPVSAAPAATPASAATPAPAAAPTPTAATAVRDVYRFENMPPELKDAIREVEKQSGLTRSMLDRPDVADYFNMQPLERRKAIFESRNATPVNVTAPTEAGAPTEPRRFGSRTEETLFKKGQEEYITTQQKEAGKIVGERRANLENLSKDINVRMNQVNTLLNILDETPEAVGISFRSPTMGLIMKAAESGLIPFLGKKDLEDVMATQMSPKARVNREKFESLATNIAAEYRREVAKGTGQVSDYETKMFQKATGLEKTSPAEANRYFGVLAAENLRARKKLLELWQSYPPGSDFAAFEKSKEYKAVQDEMDARLKRIFPESMLDEKGFGEKVKTTPATQEERKAWNERYGNKKP